eukprot:4687396-Amphidinium_carterae.1
MRTSIDQFAVRFAGNTAMEEEEDLARQQHVCPDRLGLFRLLERLERDVPFVWYKRGMILSDLERELAKAEADAIALVKMADAKDGAVEAD